jgi:hypothetical protein
LTPKKTQTLTQKNYTREKKTRKKGKKTGRGATHLKCHLCLRALRRWQPIKMPKINWGGGVQCFLQDKEKVLPI